MQINQIPIINYHKISTSCDIGITTRHPYQFENDLKILKAQKFKSITFIDLLQPQTLLPDSIIITFDDAYDSLLNYAMPIMQMYGFKGVVYPVTNFVGQYNDWDVQIGTLKFKHLDWQDLREVQNLGFEIGSHTRSHELLTWMDRQQQLYELCDSKKKLQDALGEDIHSVSYPFGRFNQDTIFCASEAGYEFGVASVYFKNIEQHNQKFALRRFNIYRFDTEEQFKRKIGLKGNNRIFFRDWLIQKGGIGTAVLQSIRKHIHQNGRSNQV